MTAPVVTTPGGEAASDAVRDTAHADLARLSRELWIGGHFVPGGADPLEVLSPVTERSIATVSAASPADVDRAVLAARTGFEGAWGRTPAAERGRLLAKVADLVERDAEVFARLEALDIGKPWRQPLEFDLPDVIATFRHFAGWADKITGWQIPTAGYGDRPTHSYTLREPYGVVAAVIPWNTPLLIAGWKLAPALACGNTVVLKSAEDAPLSLLHLATLLAEAGLPDGTVNIITGYGDTTGAALVQHPGVDKISFTGSHEVGSMIAADAGRRLVPVTLELGGKSPSIVLPDADPAAAAAGIAFSLFFNAGQACSSGTRVMVHRSHYDEVVERLAAHADAQVVGDPFDSATTMGPVINAAQHASVLDYLESGRTEGARLVTGGARPDRDGWFIEATVFAEVDNQQRIAREEIFGPVGSVMAFDDVEDAVALANDTTYGLAAMMWTHDLAATHLLARRLRAGMVWVNGWGAIGPALPWGGVKGSGIGRELGWSGILANTEEKTVSIVL